MSKAFIYSLVLFILFIFTDKASTASPKTRNVSCNGDITSAMNTAIGASDDGDTIAISAGSCSMSRLDSISDTNVIIQGAGKASTIITANAGFGQIITNGANSPQWQLRGFTLSGTTTSTQAIVVWGDAAAQWRGAFLIDDIELYYPNNTGQCIAIFGPIYGVISNSKFTNDIESAILTGLALTESLESGDTIDSLKGAYAASLAYQPGSSTYLYIEDNIFVGASSGGIAAIDTGYTGGRIVFRHNTLKRATLYSHWTADGNWNTLWWEVYNNNFVWDGDSGYQPMRMQGGGTGLIYNNTISGFTENHITIGEDRLSRGDSPLNTCSSSNAWDGNTDPLAPGWPCLTQTGRDAGKTMAQIKAGTKQASFPLYIWNNGPQAKCTNPSASGVACDNSFGVEALDAMYFKSTPHNTSGFGNGDIDWCKSTSQLSSCGTHTLTYTPYTYPHPLRPSSNSTSASSSSSASTTATSTTKPSTITSTSTIASTSTTTTKSSSSTSTSPTISPSTTSTTSAPSASPTTSATTTNQVTSGGNVIVSSFFMCMATYLLL